MLPSSKRFNILGLILFQILWKMLYYESNLLNLCIKWNFIFFIIFFFIGALAGNNLQKIQQNVSLSFYSKSLIILKMFFMQQAISDCNDRTIWRSTLHELFAMFYYMSGVECDIGHWPSNLRTIKMPVLCVNHYKSINQSIN